MKRCNNCGWFNLDSSSECEKCGENSFEPVVESAPVLEQTLVMEPMPEPQPEPESVPQPESVSQPAPEPHPEPAEELEEMPEPVQEPEPEIVPCQEQVVEETPEEVPSRKAMTATIMDASVLFKEDEPEEIACPKCHYPIAGEVEYCPNCGTTIKAARKPEPVNEKPAEEIVPQPQSQSQSQPEKESPKFSQKTVLDIPKSKSKSLKATVRDIPEELLGDDKIASATVKCEKVGSLVPVDGADDLVIEIFENEEVVIAGRKYRFQK